jgi:hypothetical protein
MYVDESMEGISVETVATNGNYQIFLLNFQLVFSPVIYENVHKVCLHIPYRYPNMSFVYFIVHPKPCNISEAIQFTRQEAVKQDDISKQHLLSYSLYLYFYLYSWPWTATT